MLISDGVMPVSGVFDGLPDPSYDSCGLLALDGALDNDHSSLIDLPLFDADPGDDVALTSEQWADLLLARRAAGRPLSVAGPDGAEEHGHQVGGAGTRLIGEQGCEGQAVGDVHGLHAARADHDGATMTGASFRGDA